jgi:hypothetical protein
MSSDDFIPAAERAKLRAQGVPIQSQSNSTPTPQVVVDCLNRSVVSVGRLKCTCSNQPECYTCSNPMIPSGYCLAAMPVQPGEGAIVTHDGTSISPKDTRFRQFLPWPLRNGEIPHDAALVVCSTCPHRQEPSGVVARLRKLGIDGDYDPETGHCDVLHYLPNQRDKIALVEVPAGVRACKIIASKSLNMEDALAATECRVLILYWNNGIYQPVKSAGKRFPNVKFWFVTAPAQQRRERIENVSYDLPDDMEAEFQAHRRAAYTAAIAKILS